MFTATIDCRPAAGKLSPFGYTIAQTTLTAPAQDQAAARKPDVVFVPTPQAVVDKMLELAEVNQGDVVYDLGCGDGRIVVTAARRSGVKAVGFDIDPKRIKERIMKISKRRIL